MLKNNEKAINVYKRLGAKLRLLKRIESDLEIEVRQVLPKNKCSSLSTIRKKIDKVCSDFDDQMFHDFPEIDNSYTHVFYGDIVNAPRCEVDKEVIEEAKRLCNGYFK